MDAGTTNSDLRVKIVSNTAQSQSGDPVPGCNIGVAGDGFEATVTFLITPGQGLTADPNPITFDECGKVKTVKLTATIGGTYTITAQDPVVDNAPGAGVYHLDPFGLTVVVVDTTPPETTIDSGPNNPTSSQSATFTFHSNEAGSTFECSLDSGVFVACDSNTMTSYAGLAEGPHTFEVRATDPSGNTDQSPDTYAWTVKAVSIGITSVTPSSTPWGKPVTVVGTADVVDLTGLVVNIDWGDSSSTTGVAITDGNWQETHTYLTAGTHIIKADLMQGATSLASATSQVVNELHDTALVITSPAQDEYVTTDTKLLIGARLTDVDADGSGVSGETIEITGASPHITQGVTFTGNDLVLSSCADPPCTIDPIGTDDSNPDNKVLYVKVGTEITFPTTTTAALIYVQDTPVVIEFRVIEYGGIQQDCGPDPGLQDCVLGVPDPGEAGLISVTSGFNVVNGVTVFNGIEKIIITKVGGSAVDGTVGIAAFKTLNEDSSTSDLIVENFEDDALGPKPSPFTVDGGSAFAYVVTQSTEASDILVQADFAGHDDLYKPSSASVTYNVQLDQDPLGQGVGAAGEGIVSGSGNTQSGRSCTGSCDLDLDGIPDTEERQGFVDDGIVAPGKTWSFPEAADDTKVDIYYEVDCMAGVTCLTQAQATYVEDRFKLHNINMHIDIDETNICSAGSAENPGAAPVNPVVAWTNGNANECDDFKSIKLNHFGTSGEKVGGDLGSGNGVLKLKHLVSRYVLMTYNTNVLGNTACGTSGVAEYIGNDAIVSVQCLLDTANPTKKPETILGTFMHEIGHTLGLQHGGTSSINCMPNYVSVMNYIRQAPTSNMAVMAAGATTNYGWYGDYSQGPLLYQSAAGVNVVGDGKKIPEVGLADNNRLVLTGTWKEANGAKLSTAVGGLATVLKFNVLWSDTTAGALAPIKSGYAATTFAAASSINWNGIAGLTAGQDLNYLTVTIGSKQLPACTQSSELTDLPSPPGDYNTILANVYKPYNEATDQLGLSGPSQDPDHDPEMNLRIYNELNSLLFESPGVQPPLNNVGFGDPQLSLIKKGSTVNVKFDLFDGEGNKVTDTNSLSVYKIERIDLVIAQIVGGTPPDDGSPPYFSPQTSTQSRLADRFDYDGSKWSFSYGTKNLVINAEYAARIQIKFITGELFILDNKNDSVDNVSFVFKIVKT